MSATRIQKMVAEVADSHQCRQPHKSPITLSVTALVAVVADSYSRYVNYRIYTPCTLCARPRKEMMATSATSKK